MYLKINKKKIWKKKIEKKVWKKKVLIFSFIFKSVKSPASGKENIRFPDSPDFVNFPDIRTRRDVR